MGECTTHRCPPRQTSTNRKKYLGFWAAVATCLRKSVQFHGRATHDEFWYFFVFCLSVFAATLFLGVFAGGKGPVASFASVPNLLLLVPWISAGVRRLHDTGRTGGWFFLYLSVLGIVVVIIMWNKPSQPHANRYG